MRRALKFLHTMGAIGMMGAMACLLVLLAFTPPPTPVSEYAVMRAAMGAIATWIFLPSLGLTLGGRPAVDGPQPRLPQRRLGAGQTRHRRP